MQKLLGLILACVLTIPILSDVVKVNAQDTQGHYDLYMSVDDFDADFKTLGKSYISPSIYVPYSVSTAEDSYNLTKTETSDVVTIKADGYAFNPEYSFITLTNAVEAYFDADKATFVRDNFDYTQFGVSGEKEKTVGDCTFRFLKGNGHTGFKLDITRAGIFSDLDNTLDTSAIARMYGEGIIKGVGDGKFEPNRDVTRAEFAVMFARLMGYSADKDESLDDERFEDIKSGDVNQSWYIGEVNYMAEQGLIMGYPLANGNFAYLPNNNISREEMYVIAHRYLLNNGGVTRLEIYDNYFVNDIDQVSDWAADAIDAMLHAGMIRTRGESIEPKSAAMRLEAAEMFDKAREYTR
ncbi:MAG: S-layer homology domain-containing protein [Clostridiales bacterium]|nr:S-layer homology domain-containing protein [Clostridiales bacterium]